MDSPSTEATLWSLTQECESPRNRKSRAVVSRRRLSALGYLNDAGGPLGVYLSAQICHRTAALDPVRRVSLRCDFDRKVALSSRRFVASRSLPGRRGVT